MKSRTNSSTLSILISPSCRSPVVNKVLVCSGYLSPRIFKLLKEEIIRLSDEGFTLLRMSELNQQLEIRLPDDAFTYEQLLAVVGLLAGPGHVWQLEFGQFVLLYPERINSYAAAVGRTVQSHLWEIGVIHESAMLAGLTS